ncbi:MAG: ATP-binding protein [Bacteroidia bacterium]|nr:ATP-binding protein [Bacteroidia bacterium]
MMQPDAERRRVKFIQIVLIAGASMFLGVGLMQRYVQPELYDPFWLRMIPGSAMLLVIAGARRLSVRRLEQAFVFSIVLAICWSYAVLYQNNLNQQYVQANFIMLAALPFIAVQRSYMLMMNGLALALCIAVGLSVQVPQQEVYAFISLTVMLLGLGNIFTFHMARSQAALDANLKTLSEVSEQLRKSEERWNYALVSSHEGVWDTDYETQTLYLSPVARQILGYEPEDLTAGFQEWASLVHPDDRDRVMQELWAYSLSPGGMYRSEYRVRTKAGGWKWIESRGQMILDPATGRPKRFIGTHTDIHEQKQAEEQLARSEARHKALVDANPDLILRISQEGCFLDVATQQEEELLIPKDRIIGSCIRDLPIGEDLQQQLQNMIARSISEGAVCMMEYSIDLPAGRNYYELRMVRSGDDEVIAHIRNTTQQQAYQQALIEARDRAEEAARARAQFLSTMSHEIRTPLNGVIGLTHLLLQENPRPDQLENLQSLKFSAENLLSIVNDILDYSKIESGRIEFEQSPMRLTDLINGIAHPFRLQAAEHGVELRLNLDPAIPEVLIGDPTRLSQVLSNLIGNAVKFTRKGFIQVSTQHLDAEPGQSQVYFEVADTGIGIPADKLDRIFESFTQASATTTREFGGTGLGLAICRQLLRLQHSSIQVESEEGKGSRFFFTLAFPLPAAGGPKLPPLADAPESPQFQGVAVLLAEDNLVNQRIAKRFLEKWGAQVTLAEHGAKAVQLAGQHPFDLILMDLQMPVMDGYEATRHIRQLGTPAASAPIIALTASALLDIREEALKAGMDDFAAKPFNPQDLYRKIRETLERAGRLAGVQAPRLRSGGSD